MAALMLPSAVLTHLNAGGRAGASLDHLVRATDIAHRVEAGQAVADHLTVRIQTAFGESRNRAVAEAGDPPQLQAHRLAFRRGFHGRDERRLAWRAATAFAAGPLPAEVGVVDLHSPGQTLAGVALHHHLRQLGLHLPCRGLLHAQAAAQLNARNPLLALGQVVHGAEPQAERHMGGGENGARGQRRLTAAGTALKQPARRHLAIRPPTADRALETIRPTRVHHHSPALLLCAVALFELRLAEPLLELHAVL